MDIGIILTAIGVITGLVVGVFQIIDVIEKRREKKAKEKSSGGPNPQPKNGALTKPIEKQGLVPLPSTPYNLPRAIHLIGRDQEIRHMIDILSGDTPLVILIGLGGVGKTALATGVANQMWEDRQFQQIIWISAKKSGLNLASFLNEIATAIDYPYVNQLPISKQPSELIKLLRNSRCLILVDNFETVEETERNEIITFLLSLPITTKSLITSRPPLAVEELIRSGGSIYELSGLDQSSAETLITKESQRMGAPIIHDGSEDLIANLYRVTGGNPLALILAISQARYGEHSLSTVIENLHKAKGNLFQEIFGRTWLLLSATARDLLKASSLFAESFSKEALFSTQSYAQEELDVGFEQLLQFALFESNYAYQEVELRFEIHALTKAFSEAKLDAESDERTEISLKLARYFMNLAQQYEVRFWEGREIYGPLEKERVNILSIMDWCWVAGQYEIFAELAKTMADFLNVRGDWQLCMMYGKKAIDAASRIENQQLQAWLLVHMLGYLHASRYEFAKAEVVLLQALSLYKEPANMLDDQQRNQNNQGISETLRNLARVYRKMNALDQAEIAARDSYKIAVEVGDPVLIAVARNELGKLERDKGNLEESMNLFRQAIEQLDEKENSIHAGILANMAGVAFDMNNLTLAENFSMKSYQYFMSINNKEGLATALWRLAEIKLGQNSTQAEKYARDAFELFNRLGMMRECEELERLLIQISQKIPSTHK